MSPYEGSLYSGKSVMRSRILTRARSLPLLAGWVIRLTCPSESAPGPCGPKGVATLVAGGTSRHDRVQRHA